MQLVGSIILIVTLLAGSSFAQTGQVSQQRAVRIALQTEEANRIAAQAEEINKTLSRTLIEYEHCRNTGKLNEQKIKALQDQVASAEGLLVIYKQMAEDYKAAGQARASAGALDEQRIANYEKQIANHLAAIASYERSIEAYKTEVIALRAERDRLRSQRKYIAGLFLALGIGLGVLAAGNSK